MRYYPRIKLIIIVAVAFVLFLRGQGKPSENTAEANTSVPSFTLVKEANGKYSMLGQASWYSRNSPGINKRTANNEVFKDTEMTCAIWGAAFNSRVKVTNLKNGKSVILRVNDRGPHGRYFRQGRIIDLTKTAFQKLSDSQKGLIQVKVEFL
jgi:rare lipoprotein A